MKYVKMNYLSLWLLCSISNICAESNSENWILATIPKSGTHFLSQIVERISGKQAKWCTKLTELSKEEMDNCFPASFYISHAPGISENFKLAKDNKVKIILLIRDPRDVLVSYAHWVRKDVTNLMYYTVPYYRTLSLYETISAMINHYPCSGDTVPSYTTIDELYRFYLAWQQYPAMYMTKFELLIGSQGGGDDTVQREEIMNIATFLGRKISQEDADLICSGLFGGSRTFREGRWGTWKDNVDEEQKKALKVVVGKLLIQLGYEKNFDW